MLPKFPNFKDIQIEDEEEIQKITSLYPPYSDFDFYSLWSWDIDNAMGICVLNGNLVVRFTDYISGELFYSFLGTNKVGQTLNSIFELCIKEGIEPECKLIPEIVVSRLSKRHFKFDEERKHFDYIISIDKLMPHDGTDRKLSSRRKLIKKFKEKNSIEIRKINIFDKDIEENIKRVYTNWELQVQKDINDIEHLRKAINRIFLLKNNSSILSIGAYLNNELIGYSINSICSKGYAVGHFQQGDIKTFSGIYALLMHEVAPFMKEEGCELLNLEQDLEIPGLRSWKTSHKPVAFLKKYKVRPVENTSFFYRWFRGIIKS